MKDPRMTPVSHAQPGFKLLKKGASRKSERRSTRYGKGGTGKRVMKRASKY